MRSYRSDLNWGEMEMKRLS